MRHLAATTLALLAVAPPAFADQAPVLYEKKTIAVVEAGDRHAHALSTALAEVGRYNLLPVSDNRPIPELLGQIAAQAGKSSAYAFVPRFRFGTPSASIGEPMKDTQGRIVAPTDRSVTVTAHLNCPFTCHVDIYRVADGKLIRGIDLEDTLTRKVEYTYDRRDSAADLQYKATQLGIRVGIEMARPPHEAFESQAASAAGTMASQLAGRIRTMEEFRLEVAVVGWDAARDRVFFNLGTGLAVHPDDWYRVERGGKDVGFLKIRALDATRSEAQPVFLDTPLAIGDHVIEYPKGNVWHGVKSGVLALNTGLAGTLGYGLQWDIGPTFRLSELYFTLDANGFTGASGFAVDVGLTQKYFSRRWGLSWGVRAGGLNLQPLTGNAMVPAGQVVAGLDCFLNPWFVWNTELGGEAVWPVAKTGGGVQYPVGAVARTGLSIHF